MARKARRLLREYGAEETPQALQRRGGSPARPRKAKRLGTGKEQPVPAMIIQGSFP
ncbi:hypothetical protein ACFPA1_14965 [Neobacillus sp. GCM10023253]|uniref:hypothetical protein n=1 Tax=Neobacillus sp. GCM10023253 TaxID=3252644 RepID=UPI0036228FA3